MSFFNSFSALSNRYVSSFAETKGSTVLFESCCYLTETLNGYYVAYEASTPSMTVSESFAPASSVAIARVDVSVFIAVCDRLALSLI